MRFTSGVKSHTSVDNACTRSAASRPREPTTTSSLRTPCPVYPPEGLVKAATYQRRAGQRFKASAVHPRAICQHHSAKKKHRKASKHACRSRARNSEAQEDPLTGHKEDGGRRIHAWGCHRRHLARRKNYHFRQQLLFCTCTSACAHLIYWFHSDTKAEKGPPRLGSLTERLM